ncbi:DUF445 family protein [Desulfotalea psychrophila]|uniref:DUF445 domain-containing protein n=1 Tax=Desulfotalea psychrophila (strain LSv54 / DSM 12343) TaxID=177439 RepID=Q6ALB3_DESPS|nr:DUF445 family protein [Desulfotalea psychrophila]CAG36862.1 hypothetical protein DP2133 [Desulfotalea psychrophila LSv54]
MPVTPADIFPIAQYIAPPMVGAFIGYLTNKIAIKMLFRPLNPWHIFGMRVPMTPGVIPAKRHELAENMGRMVADYLITGTEVQKAIEQKHVQAQVHDKIQARGEALAQRDLGTLQSLLPPQFSCYYGLAVDYLSYKIKDGVSSFIGSDQFARQLRDVLQDISDKFLAEKLSSLLAEEQQAELLVSLQTSLSGHLGRFLSSPACEQWLENAVHTKVQDAFQQNSSLADILPEASYGLLKGLVEKQVQPLLAGVGGLLATDDVREKIIDGACGGVESFIASMGPMGAMVGNFIKMETVRAKIADYLDEKEEDILAWIQGDVVGERVTALLNDQLGKLFAAPMADLVRDIEPQQLEALSKGISHGLFKQLQDEQLQGVLTETFTDSIKGYMTGDHSIQEALADLLGQEKVALLQESLLDKSLTALRSERINEVISTAVDSLLTKGLACKIGKLSRFLNENMRDSIYQSLQSYLTKTVSRELPGMVKSFNLQQIVADKVDSLDLLKLEQLLLSIMEEQFKYINLFGALLGFILGCINLFFLALA